MTSFAEFGLLSSLVRSLTEKHLQKPTEIQARAIPLLLGGDSVVGISETGSGKTLAYALPMLHSLKAFEMQGKPVKDESAPRAVVLAPTRELGEQISKVFKTLTHDTRLRVRTALGGMSLEQARRNVAGSFEILLATPGRLVQLLDLEQIDLSDVQILIFDEADQMLDPGFLPDSKKIAAACSGKLQLGLFSATVSSSVEELMNSLFAGVEVIRSAGSGKVVKSLVTKNLRVENGKRWPVLEKLLKQPSAGGTLLFTNTREQCDQLAKLLTDKGYACGIYRGEMDKNERRQNLKKFRDGFIELLVATDLAGRGLDIENVGRVINYHLPKEMENYLHRVGRTARAGRTGLVFNLITERDESLIARLEGRKLPPARKTSPQKSAQKSAQKLSSKSSQKSSPSRSQAGPRKKSPSKGQGPKRQMRSF